MSGDSFDNPAGKPLRLIVEARRAARKMVVDDLYNDTPEPWSAEQRELRWWLLSSRRPWDRNIHGDRLHRLNPCDYATWCSPANT